MEISGIELSTADLALGLALAGVAVLVLKWMLTKYQAINADGEITLNELLDVAEDAVDEVRAAAAAVETALAEYKLAKEKEAADKAVRDAEAAEAARRIIAAAPDVDDDDGADSK